MTPEDRPGGEHGSAGMVNVSAAERVEFAWQRTGLALAGIGLLIVRRSLPEITTSPTVGMVLLGVGVLSTVSATVWHLLTRRRPVSLQTQMRLVTTAAVLIGMLAFVVGAGH
jgi:uncharacterized membrane protein YidH (DUF202 family)